MNITSCMKTGVGVMATENPLATATGALFFLASTLLVWQIFSHTLQQQAPLLVKDERLFRDGKAPEHSERRPTFQKLERLRTIQKGTAAAFVAHVAFTCGLLYYKGCRQS